MAWPKLGGQAACRLARLRILRAQRGQRVGTQIFRQGTGYHAVGCGTVQHLHAGLKPHCFSALVGQLVVEAGQVVIADQLAVDIDEIA